MDTQTNTPLCTFLANYRKWNIQFASQDELRSHAGKPHGDDIFFGLCNFEEATIYILETLDAQALITTLVHELTHCYLFSYTQGSSEFDEEDICNLNANMYMFVNSVMEDFLDASGIGETYEIDK